MNPDGNEMKRCIEELFLGENSVAFQDLEKRIDVFCPFEAIGMVRQEIRHGSFLSYLLNPNRPHGLGDFPLREFLYEICSWASKLALPVSLVDVHLMQLDRSRIQREWRRIDLLIELPASSGEGGTVIAVELKIDAPEGGDQLERYKADVEKHFDDQWDKIFVFMTPDGRKPSSDYGDGWLPVGLEGLLSAWDKIVPMAGENAEGRALLKAYIKMIRRHILKDDELEKLAREVWIKHETALNFLMQKKPDILGDILESIYEARESFSEYLSKKSGHSFYVDTSENWVVRFTPSEWRNLVKEQPKAQWLKSNLWVTFELIKHQENLCIVFVIGPVNDESETSIREAIYSDLKTENISAGVNRVLSARARRLTSRAVLMSENLELYQAESISIEELVETIKKKSVQFIIENFATFDRVVRKAYADCDRKEPAIGNSEKLPDS